MEYIFESVFLLRDHKRKLLYLADQVQRVIAVLLSGGAIDDNLLLGLLKMEQMYHRHGVQLRDWLHLL